MTIYGVFDKKLPGINNIFPCPSDGYAIRSIQETLSPTSAMYKFSEDFCIYKLAELDEGTLEVVPCKQVICELSALVTKE